MGHQQVLLQTIAATLRRLLPRLPTKLFLGIDLSCIVLAWSWQLVLIVLEPLNARLEIK